MGGRLGWALAKYAPDRLSSLINGGEAPEDFDPSVQVSGAIDSEAVIADWQAFSAENFAPDLPDMTMPILLLAGTRDEAHSALKDATNNLPNATFASLPGLDHIAAFVQRDLILEHVTKFLALLE